MEGSSDLASHRIVQTWLGGRQPTLLVASSSAGGAASVAGVEDVDVAADLNLDAQMEIPRGNDAVSFAVAFAAVSVVAVVAGFFVFHGMARDEDLAVLAAVVAGVARETRMQWVGHISKNQCLPYCRSWESDRVLTQMRQLRQMGCTESRSFK